MKREESQNAEYKESWRDKYLELVCRAEVKHSKLQKCRLTEIGRIALALICGR